MSQIVENQTVAPKTNSQEKRILQGVSEEMLM